MLSSNALDWALVIMTATAALTALAAVSAANAARAAGRAAQTADDSIRLAIKHAEGAGQALDLGRTSMERTQALDERRLRAYVVVGEAAFVTPPGTAASTTAASTSAASPLPEAAKRLSSDSTLAPEVSD